MREFCSSQFTWGLYGGSADCSDLGITAGQPNPPHFAVFSTKTDERREFYRESTRQADVQRYFTLDKQPQVAITLYND